MSAMITLSDVSGRGRHGATDIPLPSFLDFIAVDRWNLCLAGDTQKHVMVKSLSRNINYHAGKIIV